MKKYRFYLLSLWVATCSMLLTTVMLHHHHLNQICFIEETCEEDGNINDEHTAHHDEEEHGECQIQQMHHFLLNAKVVKNINKHILDGSHAFVAVLPSQWKYIPSQGLLITRWLERVVPVADRSISQNPRRGPPAIS